MVSIYLNWAILIAGFVYFVGSGDFAFAGLWIVGLPLAISGYVRIFPSISRFLGYGRVADRLPSITPQSAGKVTLYTAIGCPFCPLVRRRLLALQKNMGFELEEVDVTAKPGVLRDKGIRAVPVVEVGNSTLVGHSTSEQLANLIGQPALKRR